MPYDGDAARYPLHAAADEGRMPDLAAALLVKQAAGALAAGAPLRANSSPPPLSSRCGCAAGLAERDQGDGPPFDLRTNPPEEARSYSSVFAGNSPGTGHARSMLSSAQAWSAQHNNQDQWVIIDLGERMSVQGIIVSGRHEVCHGQKVTRVRVEVADGADGPWTECGEHECRVDKHDDEKRIVFAAAAAGRCVKLNPRAWEQHISMRCGAIAGQMLTPLDRAAMCKQPEGAAADGVRLLLAAGADATAKRDSGGTALLKAAGSGPDDAALVGLLLGAGCDAAAKGGDGKTALERAKEHNKPRMAALLAAIEADPEATLAPLRAQLAALLRLVNERGLEAGLAAVASERERLAAVRQMAPGHLVRMQQVMLAVEKSYGDFVNLHAAAEDGRLGDLAAGVCAKRKAPSDLPSGMCACRSLPSPLSPIRNRRASWRRRRPRRDETPRSPGQGHGARSRRRQAR